jgi:hypothetical protein
MTEPETIELQCEIRARSELAIMIHDGHKTVWIPRSEIVAMNVQDATAGHARATLTIPGWLAREKAINTSQVDTGTADLFGGAL